MSTPNRYTQTGGTTSHVGDCYIWAEIYYLDSTTDYRECLAPRIQEAASDDVGLIMLDEITPSPWQVLFRNVASRVISIRHAINNALRLGLGIKN